MLNINWLDAEWPSAGREGYGEASAPLSSLFELSSQSSRPALVYIFDQQAEMDKAEELDRVRFGSEEFVIATRFFRCFRIEAATVTNEKIRAKYLKKLPAVIMLDAQGNETKVLTKVKAKSLYSKLGKLYATHFAGKLSKAVKTYNETLKEIEKAEDKIADLQRAHGTIADRLERKDTKKNRKRVEESDAKIKAAQKAYDKLVEAKEKLTNPKLKKAKKSPVAKK